MASERRALEEQRVRLRLHVSRPTRETTVVKMNGQVDLGTAPRLWEMLDQRLHGSGTTVIVNLSELEFFGVSGIRALERAQLLADETGTDLFIFAGECRSACRLLGLCPSGTLHVL
ncbi:STAS domain-containing protein [Amycolatopsis sp. WAC 04169]|uniref:STAS domain-containing protein n=1 Tax=Amycolatopsis sp. WAC 04169 TaxID=2203197 RepID=UPI001F39782F|nr:STAS domain-containing protein [Amycolatopsis sp. WAC 04169]